MDIDSEIAASINWGSPSGWYMIVSKVGFGLVDGKFKHGCFYKLGASFNREL